MNRLIRNLTSLANFAKARGIQGQTATLLILLTVILLIFVMVTLNIGSNAMTSTVLSNAADSAALYLGSQLSTKSRQVWAALDNSTEQCTSSGWASAIFALVAVIAVAILAPYLAPAFYGLTAGSVTLSSAFAAGITSTGTMAIAGAVGGATGASYAGTDVVEGAITGAAIGAGVSSVATGVSNAVSASTPLSAGAAGPVAPLSSALYANAGAIALGSLSLGATAYNQSVAQQIPGEVSKQFNEMMGKLSELDRMRESVFLQALQQVVDDPNLSQDNFSSYADSDLDGNTSEYVSDFQIWEFARLKKIGELSAYSNATFENFINGPMTTFLDYAATTAQDLLARQDYKWDIIWDSSGKIAGGTELAVAGTVDSALVKLTRGLETGGPGGVYPLTFWDAGPTASEMNSWLAASCTTASCPDAPAGYDQVDAMADKLLEMAVLMAALKNQDISAISASWESWLPYFYDAGEVDSAGNCVATNPSSYYCILGKFAKYANPWAIDWSDPNPDLLMSWFKEIDTTEDNLPAPCVDDDADGLIDNYPCRFNVGVYGSGTVDANSDDEVAPVPGAFFDLYSNIASFRSTLKTLYDTMVQPSADVVDASQVCAPNNKTCGGINPVRYEWSDARENHSVLVEIGPCGDSANSKTSPITVANTRTDSWCESDSFLGCLKSKTCTRLNNYTDGGNCYVKITRNDGTKNMGTLGAWNPYGGSVSKAAWVDYSYDKVQLCKKGSCE